MMTLTEIQEAMCDRIKEVEGRLREAETLRAEAARELASLRRSLGALDQNRQPVGHPPRQGLPGPSPPREGSIKWAVMQVFQGETTTLSPKQIHERIRSQLGQELSRKSLGPQIGRLATEGLLVYGGHGRYSLPRPSE